MYFDLSIEIPDKCLVILGGGVFALWICYLYGYILIPLYIVALVDLPEPSTSNQLQRLVPVLQQWPPIPPENAILLFEVKLELLFVLSNLLLTDG